MPITVSREGRRGCGYRKVGGIYLVASGEGKSCGLLPLELHNCPTCGSGIKQTRGWTWIDPSELFKDEHCEECDRHIEGKRVIRQHVDVMFDEQAERLYTYCRFSQVHRAGLLWVGEKFYATPEEYSNEAREMGISRRIKAVPREYIPGETWVLLAHPKVSFREKDARAFAAAPVLGERIAEIGERRPGIFRAFLPDRIEKIVRGDESEEEIAAIEAAGMVPVQVERLGENVELFGEGDAEE